MHIPAMSYPNFSKLWCRHVFDNVKNYMRKKLLHLPCEKKKGLKFEEKEIIPYFQLVL